jgi:hypothetical protein
MEAESSSEALGILLTNQIYHIREDSNFQLKHWINLHLR